MRSQKQISCGSSPNRSLRDHYVESADLQVRFFFWRGGLIGLRKPVDPPRQKVIPDNYDIAPAGGVLKSLNEV